MIKSFKTKFTDNEVETWPVVGVKMEYYYQAHFIANLMRNLKYVSALLIIWKFLRSGIAGHFYTAIQEYLDIYLV